MKEKEGSTKPSSFTEDKSFNKEKTTPIKHGSRPSVRNSPSTTSKPPLTPNQHEIDKYQVFKCQICFIPFVKSLARNLCKGCQKVVCQNCISSLEDCKNECHICEKLKKHSGALSRYEKAVHDLEVNIHSAKTTFKESKHEIKLIEKKINKTKEEIEECHKKNKENVEHLERKKNQDSELNKIRLESFLTLKDSLSTVLKIYSEKETEVQSYQNNKSILQREINDQKIKLDLREKEFLKLLQQMRDLEQSQSFMNLVEKRDFMGSNFSGTSIMFSPYQANILRPSKPLSDIIVEEQENQQVITKLFSIEELFK